MMNKIFINGDKKSHDGINKVFFLGSKNMGYRVLKKMYSIDPHSLERIITIDDSDDDRSCYDKFCTFATQNNIPLSVLNKPSELSPIVGDQNPELIMVVGWYWIIPTNIIEKVPNGIIGIHSSLLPQYRGFAPLVWSIINGDTKTGISLFYLAEGIDKGDIIDQRQLLIGENTTISSLLNDTEQLSIEMINQHYKKILKRTNNKTPQSAHNISYCAIRKPEDGRINWSKDNNIIHNFIRAQSDPYPGAFTYIKDKKYYIIDSRIIRETYYGAPGTIAQSGNNSITVCCGKNALELTHIREEQSKENIVNKMKFGKKFE